MSRAWQFIEDVANLKTTAIRVGLVLLFVIYVGVDLWLTVLPLERSCRMHKAEFWNEWHSCSLIHDKSCRELFVCGWRKF